MRLIRVAIPVSFLFFATACGGSTTTTTPPAAGPTSASPSASASGGPSSSAASGQTLTGTIGTPENPELFEIALKDSTGTKVTTLKAGTYQVKITDKSKAHNFHLTGAGGADFTTGPIAETPGEVTWPVTLVAGDYKYQCDPHKNMVETFTVT